MNYKLTPNTFNGAEGYNNKFNDIINTLQQQGHSLSPPILKSVYLANIQDNGRGHGRGQFQGQGQAGRVVSDQYYSPNEQVKLSLAQKNEIF